MAIIEDKPSKSAMDTRSVGVAAWRRVSRQPAANVVIVFVVFQVLVIAAALAFPEDFRYLSQANVSLLFRAIPILGIMALGVGLLMISGEFDLSVGSVFTLTSYAMAMLFSAGWPVWLAVLLTLGLGALLGIVNGAITVKTAIPSFITTLGSMLVLRGIVRWVSEGQAVSFLPGGRFEQLLVGSIYGLPVQILWFLGLAAGAGILLHRTRLGNHIYLIGGSLNAALAVGVNAHRVKVAAFALSAIGATIAGILSTARVNTVTPSQGTGLELKAIAICVIGGLFLTGGRGTILGIVVGAFLMYTVEDVLLLLRAPGFYLEMFIGAILVGAVIMNTWVAKKHGG
ncbi:MAG: ABC transporter permease [Dongiaceae bacterium]